MPAAAVLLFDGCTIAECIEAATRLSHNSFDVVWVSLGGADVVDQSGLHLQPAAAISEIDASGVDVLLVPGGDPAVLIGDDSVHQFVQAVAARGVVAGICAGVVVLADAGVLAGRRATHNYRSPWAPSEVERHVAGLFANVAVEQDRSIGIVVDDRLITALPNATAEFAIAVCHAAGIYEEGHARLLTRHLQGDFVPRLFGDEQARSPAADSVRRASADDIDELIDLQVQLFEEDAGVHERFADLTWPSREGRNDFETLLASDEALVLVAQVDGDSPCGFLVGYLTPSSPTRQPVTYAILRSLYVQSQRRNSDIGAALTEAFIDWARSRDAAEAQVNAYAANAGAQRFYERHGFVSHSIQRTLPLAPPTETT